MIEVGKFNFGRAYCTSDANREDWIMPDPSNEEFEVINGLKEKAIAAIRIYSLDGQLIFDKEYPDKEVNIRIKLDGTKGTFLYQATDRSGKVYSGKLIVE